MREGMRPSRSCAFLRSQPSAPRPRDTTTPDGDKTSGAVDGSKGSVPCASKSGSKIPSHDIPLWAAAEVSRGHRSSASPCEKLDPFDSGTGRPSSRDVAVVKERLSLSKQSVAAGRVSRLEPLLTVGETAAILNLSARTVRRLITSGSIRAVWIGRSVRLRPRDIERLIATGDACND